MAGPRIVTLDIETSPIEAYTWGTREQNVGLDQVRKPWSILGFSYKVLGKKRVYWFGTGGRGRAKVRDDKALCRELWKVLDAADIVVGHNIRKFDLRRIRARLIEHGFKPPSPSRAVDTFADLLPVAEFISHKLAHLAPTLTKFSKDDHRKYPGMSMWIACLDDVRAAWETMAKYCKRDVVACEKLFLKFRPWIRMPNVANYIGDEENKRCPACGSKDLHSRGHTFTQTGRYYRLQCYKCGAWSRSRTSLARPYAKNLLAG